MQVVIPSRKNRRSKRVYDKHLYELRHLVEECNSSFKTVERYSHKICKK